MLSSDTLVDLTAPIDGNHGHDFDLIFPQEYDSPVADSRLPKIAFSRQRTGKTPVIRRFGYSAQALEHSVPHVPPHAVQIFSALPERRTP
jgi:hypothetical protein